MYIYIYVVKRYIHTQIRIYMYICMYVPLYAVVVVMNYDKIMKVY